MSIDITQELHQNFIDFSYEANSQRAFPDARDGLKPGQRACLWEMYEKGYIHSKPHVKSAKISGGVAATWWPHGTTAIYDTFTRMSQNWINNIPEVEWHGANGSIIISNEAAADRYTEARLSAAAQAGMFEGIKQNNVPMINNFTEDAQWPEVLPAVMPRLLINGSMGIGVTIANTWLPMNLNECADVIKSFVKDEEIDYNSLKLIDFPSGGIIINSKELGKIHSTGKGKVVLRGITNIKNNIIEITSFPYQVYIEPWIESVKKLVNDGTITGIEDIYNKSSNGKILVEVECSGSPSTILQQLFKLTDLQNSYNANQFALIGNKTPTLLTLKDYLKVYTEHNYECIKREYKFNLEKATSRLEIVEGLLKAIVNIDDIIALIKASDSSAHARENLIKKYGFSEAQAKAITNMKLGTLARLEGVELEKEKKELTETIEECNKILSNRSEQINLFITRLNKFVSAYGYTRHTQLTDIAEEKVAKEIVNVEPEKCVVIMTESGLIKRIPTSSFREQKKGGKGIKTKDDIVSSIIRTNTIDSLMVFTNTGTMYRLLVNDIPAGTNTTKGTPIRSLINLQANEQPIIIYSIYRDTKAKYVLFVTKNGTIKKTSLEEYTKTIRKTGISCLKLREGDVLADATLIDNEDIVIVTKNGMGIRFKSSEVAASGRATIGIKGISLKEGDSVIKLVPIRDVTDDIAIFTVTGLGKRMSISELPEQKRSGKGVAIVKDAELADAIMVNDSDMVLAVGVSNSICISASEITKATKNAVGTQIIKGTRLQGVSKI